ITRVRVSTRLQHEADAPQTTPDRLYAYTRQRERDGGIAGVTAGEEHADARHRRERMRGGDGAVEAHDDGSVGMTMRRHHVLLLTPCASARSAGRGSSDRAGRARHRRAG